MKYNSLKNLIYQHLKGQYPEWVHKGKLGRIAVLDFGYENENMGRRCRDLVAEGLIEVRYEKGCALYRWKIPPKKGRDEVERELLSAALL